MYKFLIKDGNLFELILVLVVFKLLDFSGGLDLEGKDYLFVTAGVLGGCLMMKVSKLEESIAELQAHNGIVPDSSTDDPPSKIITDV